MLSRYGSSTPIVSLSALSAAGDQGPEIDPATLEERQAQQRADKEESDREKSKLELALSDSKKKTEDAEKTKRLWQYVGGAAVLVAVAFFAMKRKK